MRIGGVNISSDTLTSVSGSVVTAQGISQVAVANHLFAVLTTSQTTNLTTSDHVKFDTINDVLGTAVSLDISTAYSNTVNVASIGRFRLKQGFTYLLLGVVHFASAGGRLDTQWYDATNGAFIGVRADVIPNSNGGNEGNQPISRAYFTPTTDVYVELRIAVVSSVSAIDVSQGAGNAAVSWASIETINAYVPVVNTINSAIRRNNGTTQGATNTTVVIYSTAVSSTGSDITYVNSAANGDSFLINTTGVYSITAIAQPSNNNANLELRAGTLDNAGSDAKTLALIQTDQTNDNRSVSWTGPLTAGQSAWVRSSTSLTGGQFLNQVTIVRVA